jgi:uncharacterized NAD(P)/FAD-binding protein YdhS
MVHTHHQDFAVEIHEDPKEIRGLLKLVKSKIITARGKGVAWQNVLDALRPRTSRFWKNLTPESKRYFLQRLKPYWEVHRHRMPPVSATAIEALRDSGQLQLLAGNIESVASNDGKVYLQYTSSTTGNTQRLTLDHIINCTGPHGDYNRCNNVVFKKMLAIGWMVQDDLKLGIKTGVRGEIMKQNGVVLQNAFAVGPVRKATEWESTAIREIRTHAENVAFHIVSKTEQNHEVVVELGL